jgi:hypothetical protein
VHGGSFYFEYFKGKSSSGFFGGAGGRADGREGGVSSDKILQNIDLRKHSKKSILL